MSLSQLHKPVLLSEVLKSMENFFSTEQSLLGVDGTFGRGGHSLEILKSFPKAKILGVDQDIDAIEYGNQNFANLISEEKLELLHANFSDSEKINKSLKSAPDFILLDIGVSSPQLDNPERGFSFYHDGPLDMRMNQTKGQTAADIINEFSLEELSEIFLEYGEVKAPQKLLNAIKERREEKSFERTLELSSLIEKTCGWRSRGKHPATQYFQALRVYVNAELDHLKEALEFYTDLLKEGGILLLITFHSLEDRMAKYFFRDSKKGVPVNKKVIKPTREEELENKRARSAKLRVFIKQEEI